MMEKNNTRHILFCRCKGERINPSLSGSVKDYLIDSRASVTILNDLCGFLPFRGISKVMG